MNHSSSNSTKHFRERVFPSVGALLPLLLVYPSFLMVFIPINPALGHLVGAVTTALAIAFIVKGSPQILFDGQTLRVGSAAIELSAISKIEIVEKVDAFAERTSKLDARAFLSIKSSVPRYLKIWLKPGSVDPTPYWLVSSRKADVLSNLLKA